jgi:hypothetical protein
MSLGTVSRYLTTSWKRNNVPHYANTIDINCNCGCLFAFIVALSIFFGMFFGLNYPQVVINKYYVGAHCTITNTTINSRYCPSVSCSSCSDAPGTPSCDSVSAFQSSLNPQLCATDQSQCAQETSCNDGYKCCSECCQICQS